jgi:hypothetical protein
MHAPPTAEEEDEDDWVLLAARLISYATAKSTKQTNKNLSGTMKQRTNWRNLQESWTDSRKGEVGRKGDKERYKEEDLLESWEQPKNR